MSEQEQFLGNYIKDIGGTNPEDKIESWNKELLRDKRLLLFWLPKKTDDRSGFKFCALSWLASDNEGDRYEKIADGYGYFDGVRHIWFFPESELCYGYKFYPCLEDIIAVLRRVAELEKQCCREPRK